MKNLNEFSQTKQFGLVAEVKISYYNKFKALDFSKINNSKEAENAKESN
ncbi:MAG: hypothetical protein IPQ02_12755 [Saprospiraceae bacterium]|uniref:Uncharacterized protein n=1 Tax=Candidatus Defluviibacterium haderslevense TaxID=2981993 RepID=A0A9D7S9N8_9BACT|nr:hypothetical protein [Candidatus Defluviibacterium haderslevense]MBL0237447.1 hypothetical protein [Candidatus Defluviibacterium haderslevense]